EPALVLLQGARPAVTRNVTVETALAAAKASQARDDDTVASALARTALELHLSVNETVRAMDAAARASTATTANTLQGGSSESLRDSVLKAARSAGLTEPQVDRIKTALVTIDHRNYVSVLNVMKAASNASRPELSTAEKVAAVVSATAVANFSRQQVAMAAASATRAAVGSSAATAAPLSSVARSAAAAGLSVSAQAAAVAAVGAESPRSQLAIANMFSSAAAASATPNMDMWTGGFGYGDSYGDDEERSWDPEATSVGRRVAEEVYDAPIPEKEKRAIVASATWAAARAETASRQLNGTAGMPGEVAGDFLALSRASHAAGFSDSATAVMKHQWQDMSSQQRAVAAKVLEAVSSAQGQKRPGKGSSSAERVASVVRALEDAGVPASEEAAFAAEALRHGAAVEENLQVGPGSKTILDDIVDLVKSAGLGSAQQSGILQVVASMQPA
ncbi:RPL35, partial [Symbiodinium sp. CCMP2456]